MVGTLNKKDRHAGGDSSMNASATPNTDRSRSLHHMLVAPWPEWSDSAINAEKWDVGFKSGVQAEVLKIRSAQHLFDTGFENPLERKSIPASLNDQVHEWKRALSVNPKFQVLPEDSNSLDLDLVTSNGHILHSELMRHLVASITNLYHLAAMKPFQEMGSNTFVPNGGGIWKPWNHVYAICKVGKGTKHKPAVNKFGKYVVRLHFLGQWRRITVDDLLPLDEFGRVLLPMTTRNELWPILLAKAVMLVASLTATPTSEVLEMNAVACFTGWFVLDVECKRVPDKDLWLVCQKALMNEAEDGARYKEEAKATDAYQLGMAMGGGDQKDSLKFAMCNELEEEWGSVAVFAQLADIDEDLEGEVEEIGPCVGHQVLFSEARIIKLGDDGGELPLWKTFRWKKWALQKGIIQPEHLVNVKSLRMFAPLKKWLVPRPVTASTIFFELSQFEEAIANQPRLDKHVKGKGTKGKSNERGKFTGSKEKGNKSSSKPGKSGRKSSSRVSEEDKVETVVRENTDPWINFNVYSKYVTSLHLFFRNSSFKHCESSTDFHSFILKKAAKRMDDVGPKKPLIKPTTSKKMPKSNSESQILVSTTSYKVFRPQDYFYLIIDTPTAKKLFFTVGIVRPKTIDTQNAILNQTAEETESTSSNFSLAISGYSRGRTQWCDHARLNFTVAGTKTKVLELEDGIVGLALIADLPPTHYFQIASQTEFRIGTYELVHDALAGPYSLSLTQYGMRIFSAFTNLRNCERGSTAHEEALASYHAAYIPDSITRYLTASRSLGRFTGHIRDKCEQVCTGLLYDRMQSDFEQFYTALKELQELMMAPRYGMDALQNIAPEFYELTLLRNQELDHPIDELCIGNQDLEAGELNEGLMKNIEDGELNNKVMSTGNVVTEMGKNKDVKKEKNKISGEVPSKVKKSDKVDNPLTSKNVVKPQTPHILFEHQEISGNEVLTKIVSDEPEWLKYYPFRDDDNQRLNVKDFSGTAPTNAYGDWFPIVRLVVNLTGDEPAINGIYFSTSAALCFLRIVNNDTQKCMQPIIRNISFDKYMRNVNGYTIFGYGFCDNAKIKEHRWALHVISSITEELLEFCEGVNLLTGVFVPAQPQLLKVKHVYGHYVPSKRKTVLRCILTVNCSQFLTIRLSMNNPNSEIKVKILHDANENGDSELICENTFTGKITLPSRPFHVRSEGGVSQPTLFLIEAELANENGWPLTEEEEYLVTTIKESVRKELLVYAKTESAQQKSLGNLRKGSLRSTKGLPRSQEILSEAAHWCVQVIVDAELESQVTLEPNKRKAQEIRRLKEGWERDDPGRHLRAMAERQKILEQRDVENKQLGGISGAKSKIFQSVRNKETVVVPEPREAWQVVTEDYGDKQREKRLKERQEFELKYNQLVEEARKFRTEQKKTNTILNNYLMKQGRASMALLENGYKMREACVVKPTTHTQGKGKKDKTESKGQGKEKGKRKEKK